MKNTSIFIGMGLLQSIPLLGLAISYFADRFCRLSDSESFFTHRVEEPKNLYIVV